MPYEVMSFVDPTTIKVASRPTRAEAIIAALEHYDANSLNREKMFTIVADSESDTAIEWLIFRGAIFDDIDAATEMFEELV
jgi:hypothetical protein